MYVIIISERENIIMERLKVNYTLPKMLADAIDELEKGIEEKVSYVDCLQDEVRSCARLLDPEHEEEIIDYYCRRRWL